MLEDVMEAALGPLELLKGILTVLVQLLKSVITTV
jgi:hypothetical protein